MVIAQAENAAGQASRVWLVYQPPAEPLRPYVSGYHFIEVDPGCAGTISDFNYPAWTLIRITLGGAPWHATVGGREQSVPGAAVFGVTSRATPIRTSGGLMVGAGITPLGWATLFGGDARARADTLAPLSDLVGDRADVLRADLRRCRDEAGWTSIFDRFFTGLLDVATPLPKDIAAVHRLLVDPGTHSVEQIATDLGITPRHVGRIAQRVFGLSPKLLLRRARFMRAAMPLRTPDPRPLPERVSADYADYAHFARDCRAFLGMSPSAFVGMARPISDASVSARLAMLGAWTQGLHVPAADAAAGS